MAIKTDTTQSKQGGLYDVCIALKQNVMRNLNVATFGIIKRIDESSIQVQPFPLIDGESSKQIRCTYASNVANEMKVGSICIVLFTDRESCYALMQAKKGNSISSLRNDDVLHSDSYGVVIGLM